MIGFLFWLACLFATFYLWPRLDVWLACEVDR